jgi:hypothetical protein
VQGAEVGNQVLSRRHPSYVATPRVHSRCTSCRSVPLLPVSLLGLTGIGPATARAKLEKWLFVFGMSIVETSLGARCVSMERRAISRITA